MYTPSDSVLRKYADLLVKFALNSGSGLKAKEVVYCVIPDVAKPIYGFLQSAILESGGYPMMKFVATGFDKDYYTMANNDQLTFFPKKYLKERINLIDHMVAIIAKHDLHELQDVDPDKIVLAQKSNKKILDWRNEKEYAGKFTWTLGLYGTPAMAKEANLTEKAYWEQILKACYLDKADPIAAWNGIFKEQLRVLKAINRMGIERLHVEAEGIDLWIPLGQKRKWVGGSCRNMPSYELFTSPDWRGVEGYIRFNQPLYRYGNRIKDIELSFKKGRVVQAKASNGESLLKKIIQQPNADKVGEFSLTDSRLSRITKFMANTLYDENMGGKYGNTHLALGVSYKDAYDGDPSKVLKKEWKQLGFNDSGEHADIISTEDRTVTAYLKDGSDIVIYKKGRFIV